MEDIKSIHSIYTLQDKLLDVIKDFHKESNLTFNEISQCLNSLKSEIGQNFIEF